MRILFVGHRNPFYPTVTEYFIRAFQSLGHEVYFIEYRDYFLPGRFVPTVPLVRKYEGWQLGRRFLKAVQDLRPDLLFVNYGEWLPMKALEWAKTQTGAFSVVWFADFPGNIIYQKRILEVIPHYDLVTVQGKDMGDVIRKEKGVEAFWLPAAADPSIYHPVEVPRRDEIWFVGSWYPIREKYLKALNGYPLFISGPGWDKSEPIEGCTIQPGGLTPDAIRKIYCSAAINLNIHLNKNWGIVEFTQASPRVFEIPACHGFMLTDRVPDIGELLTEGMHYAGFSNIEELRKGVEYYMKHPGEREEIAQNALMYVLDQHTYEHRVQSLLNEIEERCMQGS